MARLAFIVSVIALVISIMAYQEAQSPRGVDERLRSLQNAFDAARKETADALDRLQRSLRPEEKPAEPAPRPRS